MDNPPSKKPLAKQAKATYRRNLPHLQVDGKPLFVTFSTAGRWELPETVRGLVLQHCLHDHGTKLHMHVAVVMPDHVHLLLSASRDSRGNAFGLSEIMSGIKGASAHRVNRILDRKGSVWQDESFDHVLRCDESVREKADYICENPVRWGLVKAPEEYAWLWREWVEGVAVRQEGAS
jgi:REP element-mobilizing transposase RayT